MSLIYYSESENSSCRFNKSENTLIRRDVNSENNQFIKTHILLFHSVKLNISSINKLIDLKRKLIPTHVYICASKIEKELIHILDELNFELINDSIDKCIMCNLHNEFFPLINDIISSLIKDKRVSRITKKAIGHITQDFINVRITIISKKINISADHLSRVLKKDLGYSFREFTNEIKHRASKELLSKFSFDYDLISEKLGYGDTNNFYRFFKKREGITPKEFVEGTSNRKSQT